MGLLLAAVVVGAAVVAVEVAALFVPVAVVELVAPATGFEAVVADPVVGFALAAVAVELSFPTTDEPVVFAELSTLGVDATAAVAATGFEPVGTSEGFGWEFGVATEDLPGVPPTSPPVEVMTKLPSPSFALGFPLRTDPALDMDVMLAPNFPPPSNFGFSDSFGLLALDNDDAARSDMVCAG